MPHLIATPHEALKAYLLSRDFDQTEADTYVRTLEEQLPEALNKCFGTSLHSIYELTDSEEVERLRKQVKTNPILRNVDMNADPRYTEVLKWYRLWLKHLSVGKSPLTVPGEDDEAGNDETLAKTSTIYMEGEAAETLPEKLRRRNQQLRQACIAHFRALHGGHIVCECCGFEFSRHYAIDDDYIEVHHRTPFSATEGEHEVDAVNDLVPLCANCHRMIHHLAAGHGSCITLNELKARLIQR